jgi:hypothetical protein
VTAINSIGESGSSIASEVYSVAAALLKNGDFSTDLTYWQKIGTASGVTQNVVSGEAYLTTGGFYTSGISQIVSVPKDGITHAKYSYRATTGPSTLSVKAYDSAGTLIKTVQTISIPDAGTSKTISTADLTQFAGKDIKLSFEFSTNNYSLAIYLDDISVQNTHLAPSEPTEVTVAVTNADAAINWKAPQYGDASVTSYKVTPYRNGSPLPDLIVTGGPPATSTVFKGLTSGGDYTFRVTAINSIGASTQSTPSAVYSRPAMALKNGDFAVDLAYWERIGSGAGVTQSVVSGEASVNTSGFFTSGIAQAVTIPSSGVTSVKFAYRSTAGPYTLAIRAYDPAGNAIKTIKSYSIPSTAVAKTQDEVDLTQFAGKDIKLSFEITTANYTRNIYLDDISVNTK